MDDFPEPGAAAFSCDFKIQNSMPNYLEATDQLYREAALEPQEGLCCSTTPIWQLPGLHIPERMQKMNYGCGTTVHPRDLAHQPRVLYIGIGGGMELLQFAYFSRKPGGVTGIDVLEEMLEASDRNLREAVQSNAWFERDFVQLQKGSALSLPLDDDSVDVVAQNCLFNIFKSQDLEQALREAYRVLKPGGRLVLSDPVCDQAMPKSLLQDDRLRAMCLSGALPVDEYLQHITRLGFGTVEVRVRRPGLNFSYLIFLPCDEKEKPPCDEEGFSNCVAPLGQALIAVFQCFAGIWY